MFKEEIARRYKMLSMAEEDLSYKIKLIEACNRSDKFFFNNFLYTYDPRTENKVLPFRLWDFQEKFIDWINERYQAKESFHLEKTRDMGASWLILGWILSKMRKEKGFSAGVGSEKAAKVDTIGDMDSLIEKIRFMFSYLPQWLKPGYDPKSHSKYMLVSYPYMKSYIRGEAGDNIGRGGRTSFYLLDEFAHISRSSLVQEAVSQNTDVRGYVSTPKGRGNEFARLRWKSEIPKYTLHWRDHPNKDQDWYERQAITMTEEQIAQELDISYAKSAMGRVYKAFSAEKHANESVKYDPNHPMLVTFDFGINDPTSVVFLQDIGNIVRIIDCFEVRDTEITRIVANEKNPKNLKDYLAKFNLKINDVAGWYGDPDARNRDRVYGDTIKDFLKRRYKINLRFKLPNRIPPRILSMRLLLEHNRVKVDKDLHHVIECFENYRYPERDHGENEKPLHDWTSHTMTALEYYVVCEHGIDTQSLQNQSITSIRWR